MMLIVKSRKKASLLRAHHRLGTRVRVSQALSDEWEQHILTYFMVGNQQLSLAEKLNHKSAYTLQSKLLDTTAYYCPCSINGFLY